LEPKKIQGYYTLNFTNSAEKLIQTRLEIKFCKMKVLPPQAKQKKYLALELAVIQAIETKSLKK
jgi:hypothetical protein